MRITRENITAIGDNCPTCYTPTGPAAATKDDRQVSSIYRCVNGHEWTTNRNIDGYLGFEYAVNYQDAS